MALNEAPPNLNEMVAATPSLPGEDIDPSSPVDADTVAKPMSGFEKLLDSLNHLVGADRMAALTNAKVDLVKLHDFANAHPELPLAGTVRVDLGAAAASVPIVGQVPTLIESEPNTKLAAAIAAAAARR